jgi:ABC-type transporter Mla subunit MlaD
VALRLRAAVQRLLARLQRLLARLQRLLARLQRLLARLQPRVTAAAAGSKRCRRVVAHAAGWAAEVAARPAWLNDAVAAAASTVRAVLRAVVAASRSAELMAALPCLLVLPSTTSGAEPNIVPILAVEDF